MGGEIISNPDPLPTMFSAGLAYRPFRPLIIAFDFNLPFNLDGTDAPNPYFATGIDLTLTDFLSIQTGILIKSGLPRFVVGAALELEKVDFVINYTLDLTTQFDKLDRISLEVRFDIGDYGRKEIEDKAEKLYIEGLKLYAEGDFVNAIRKWKECLELNPIFTPAEEMIETALTSFQLQEEMLEKQIEE
ncbi:MAG: hypothetical protein GY760_29105 [Deltaproteobacteria bacterium]|nr:hypothetical protein [Deltaproteobacteria bacterium]